MITIRTASHAPSPPVGERGAVRVARSVFARAALPNPRAKAGNASAATDTPTRVGGGRFDRPVSRLSGGRTPDGGSLFLLGDCRQQFSLLPPARERARAGRLTTDLDCRPAHPARAGECLSMSGLGHAAIGDSHKNIGGVK